MHVMLANGFVILIHVLHYQITFLRHSALSKNRPTHSLLFPWDSAINNLKVHRYLEVKGSAQPFSAIAACNVHLMFLVPKYRSAISDRFTSNADLDA